VFAQTFLDAFQQRLQELGWIAGRNAEIDVRWAPDDSIRVSSAELVSLSPDVVVATNTPTTKALQSATHTIPIVFVTISDPVGTGLVSNLSRPEGNMTGFTDFEYSMAGKSRSMPGSASSRRGMTIPASWIPSPLGARGGASCGR
jgi:putative ABC transport system substrate-binding protein